MGHLAFEVTGAYPHAADKVAVVDVLSGQLADNANASSSVTH
jgi:hypothetical protein